MSYLWDTLTNVMASIGIAGRDKALYTRWTFAPMGLDQIEYAYRADWISRKVVDIPAQDSTRAWRSWQAEDDQITKLEEVERNYDVRNKVYEAMRLARLYGGSALVFGGGDNAQDDLRRPLDLDRVGKDWLKFVHVFSRPNMGTGTLIRDILSPWFAEPEYYSPSALVGESIPLLEIHPSWVVRFWGAPYSDPTRIGDPWSDSVLQAVNDAIQNAGVVGGAIANMIYEGKFDVIKIPKLGELANTVEGSEKLAKRWSAVNVAKSYVNSIVIDAEEEWQRVNTQFTGMPQVLQVYLMIASGAADIPATRMLGQSPVGMNATGDSDIRNYYDRLQSDQVTKIQPRLARFDEVLIRSALGRRPPELYYDWNPLWQIPDDVKAKIDLEKAQAAQIDATIGLVPAHALAIGRQNQLIEDGVYPGLEAAIEEAKKAGDYGAGEALSITGKPLPKPAEPPGQDEAQQQSEGGRPDGQAKPNGQGGGPSKFKIQIEGQHNAADRLLDYNEEHDPQTGRFTGPGGGGEGGGKEAVGGTGDGGGRTHPGEGYSKTAYVENGRIYTSNVDDAVRALSTGRKVELDQPKSISTLISKLGGIAAYAMAKGEEAPKFNLCDVSVKGTNLFCAETKGIKRIEMPQLAKDQAKPFLKFLESKGIKVEKDKEKASHLRATQDELDGAKAAKIANKIDAKGEDKTMRRLFVSKDDYILDGHHHWAAKLGVDTRSGKLDKGVKMKVARVNVGITKLLELAQEFTGGKGAKGFGGDALVEDAAYSWEGLFIDPDEDPEDAEDDALITDADQEAGEDSALPFVEDWDPSLYRDENECHDPHSGQFCSTGGGEAGGKPAGVPEGHAFHVTASGEVLHHKTKGGLIGMMLQHPEGATIAAVKKATGWPSVSMNAQAKAAGLTITKSKVAGQNVYKGMPKPVAAALALGPHESPTKEVGTKPVAPGSEYFEKNWAKSGSVGGYNQPTPATVAKYEEAYKSQAQPTGLQFASAEKWQKVGPQQGSNPGGTYKDEYGNNWYVKTPQTEDHARSEKLGNALYSLAGAEVPAAQLVKIDGKAAIASGIIPGAKKLSEAGGEERDSAHALLRRDFAADVWLGNRDVIGTGADNVLLSGTGKGTAFKVTRVDQGATMNYRAQGGTKAFPGKVDAEWEGLRDSSKNQDAAAVYGPMTNKELIGSVNRLDKITPADIAKTVGRFYGGAEAAAKTKTLVDRLQDLRDKRDVLRGASSATATPGQAFEAQQLLKSLGVSNSYAMAGMLEQHGITKPEDVLAMGHLHIVSGGESGYYLKGISDFKKQEGAKYGLDTTDLAHLGAYTGSAYADLNRALRENDMTKSDFEVSKRIASALTKLPPWKGVANRGTSLPTNVLYGYHEGQVRRELQFSSSQDGEGWPGNTKYHITSNGTATGGKDVSDFSSSGKHEREILFPPTNYFEVTKVETDAKGVRHISMTELP